MRETERERERKRKRKREREREKEREGEREIKTGEVGEMYRHLGFVNLRIAFLKLTKQIKEGKSFLQQLLASMF